MWLGGLLWTSFAAIHGDLAPTVGEWPGQFEPNSSCSIFVIRLEPSEIRSWPEVGLTGGSKKFGLDLCHSDGLRTYPV